MTDTIEKIDLKPINWQLGDVAMSRTHFYMIYNDPSEGITVHWNNKITNESDKRHNFPSRDNAKKWIKDVHTKRIQYQYDALARATGLDIGQRWAHKRQPQVIIEILMMDEEIVYTKAYTESQVDTSAPVKNDFSILQHYLADHYVLMLDGETIEQALARGGVTA